MHEIEEMEGIEEMEDIEESEKYIESSIYEQQNLVLIDAINDYLDWRTNSNHIDLQHLCNVDYFSLFATFTNFGKERAESLKSVLSYRKKTSPIVLLQEHLKVNSRLNNHSLDTYILEHIFDNKNLFLQWFPAKSKLATLNKLDSTLRSELYHLIINSNTTPEHASFIAKLYEDDKSIHNHLQIAFDYYIIGLQHDDLASLNAVTRLATAGNSEAQYVLGFNYYHSKKKINEAINWCIKAAESKHPKALAYLQNTSFCATQYLAIAQKYDRGVGVVKNSVSATVFYVKACALNNKDAAIRLGQMNQPDLSVVYTPKNQKVVTAANKAFNYFLIAAKQRDQSALETIRKLVEYTNDDGLRFKLGKFYFESDNDCDYYYALIHFKKLADKNINEAITQIKKLTQDNPKYLYIMARIYQNDDSTSNHLHTACDYYVASDHAEAQEHNGKLLEPHSGLLAIKALVTRTRDDALRFKLGKLYLDIYNDHLLALTHFKKLADKNMKEAITQINTLIQSNPKHAYTIAKLYEDDKSTSNHLQKACDYYAMSLHHDNAASINALTRLATADNSDAQYLLGFNYYHRKNKINEAINWCMRAAELKHPKAIAYLQNTRFSATQYLLIAKKYDEGDGVAMNQAQALIFYEKACEHGDPSAALFLAQYYQNNPTEKKSATSFRFYLKAAQLGHSDALAPLEQLGEEVSSRDQLELSKFYGSFFHNREKAAYWLSKSNQVEAFEFLVKHK